MEASALAAELEKKPYRLEINVDAEALEQIHAVKSELADLANLSKQTINISGPSVQAPGAMPNIVPSAAGYDGSALAKEMEESRKRAQAVREEIDNLTGSLGKLDDLSEKLDTLSLGPVKVSGAAGSGITVTREYAQTLREMTAAQKAFDKAAEVATADGEALNAADERADSIKRQLGASQRELTRVTKEFNNITSVTGGNIIELGEREELLKKKTSELKDQYAAARKEADKFADRLDKSAAAADEAKVKYGALNEKLAGMPEPVEKTGNEMKKLTPQMRSLSRGVSGLSALLGGAIPGVSGLSSSMSLLSLATGPTGIALAAAGATAAAGIGIYRIYSNTVSDAAKVSAQLAEESAKNTETFTKQAEANRAAFYRLQELSGFESLNDYQKEESRKLVNQLSAAYKGLGLVYDEVTGKVNGLTGAQANLSDQEKKALQDRLKEQYESAKYAADMAIKNAPKSAVSFMLRGFAAKGEYATSKDFMGSESTTLLQEAHNFSKALQETGSSEKQLELVNKRPLHQNLWANSGSGSSPSW